MDASERLEDLERQMTNKENLLKLAMNEAEKLEEQLKNAQNRCAKLHYQIEAQSGEQSETEKKALIMMKCLIEKQKQSYKSEIVNLKEQLYEKTRLCKSLEEQRQRAADRGLSLETELASNAGELREAENAILTIKSRMRKAEENFVTVRTALTEQLKSLEDSNIQLEDKVRELELSLSAEQSRCYQMDNAHKERMRSLQDVVKRLETEKETLMTSNNQMKAQVKELESQKIVQKAEASAQGISGEERSGEKSGYFPCDRRRRRSVREELLAEQVRRLTEQMGALQSSIGKGKTDVDVQKLREEVGSWKTAEAFQREKYEEANCNLLKERQLTAKLEEDVLRLKNIVAEKENNVDRYVRTLLDDASTLKQGKAELRLKCRELERQNATLTAENKRLQADKESLSAANLVSDSDRAKTNDDLDEAYSEIERLRVIETMANRKLEDKERDVRILQARCEELERTVEYKNDELSVYEKRTVDDYEAKEMRCKNLESKVSELLAEKHALQKACTDLDEQCEYLVKSRINHKEKATTFKHDLEKALAQLRDVEMQLTKRTTELEWENKETIRLTEKVTFLEEELRNVQQTYREQIDELAKAINIETEASRRYIDQLAKADLEKNDLRSRLLITETGLGEYQRDQYTLEDQLRMMQTKIQELEATNDKLTSGLRQAIEKAETFKNEKEMLAGIHAAYKLGTETELLRKDATIAQHLKLVTYLQSQSSQKKSCCLQCFTPEKMPVGNLTINDLRCLLDQERNKIVELNSTIRRLQQQLAEKGVRSFSAERLTSRSRFGTVVSHSEQSISNTNKGHRSVSREGSPRLSGWVHISRSDQPTHWNHVWALLENGRLSFYVDESPSSHKVDHIDLQSHTWTLNFQPPTVVNVATMSPHNSRLLVALKILPSETHNGYTLCINTGTERAKAVWLKALQAEAHCG